VRALTPLAQFDERVGSAFDADEADEADTVGGLVAARMGRVPRRGDRIDLGGLRFEVLRAAPRAVQLLRVEALPADAPAESA
jgi:magnesium and cobalt transporter